MHFIRGSHEPIIDREAWLRVQDMKGAPIPEYMRSIEPQELSDEMDDAGISICMRMS